MRRATWLCEDIAKETFRIFDAVRIYEALEDLTAMWALVVNPNLSFTQLAGELAQVAGEEERAAVRDQFIAKLQRKKRHLDETAARNFETVTGMAPEAFIAELRRMPLAAIAAWFTQHPGLSEILDRQNEGPGPRILVSEHEDALHSIERGYGAASQPQDYIKAFADFISSHSNTLPALLTVLTRPRDLTRKQLRELALELDRAGFSEAKLVTAWREMTNQDIAASIVGYIRQAAIGDALLPYDQRVDRALNVILATPMAATHRRANQGQHDC